MLWEAPVGASSGLVMSWSVTRSRLCQATERSF